MEKIKAKKTKDTSFTLFGVYTRNGELLSVHKTKHKASRVKNRHNKLNNTECFVDKVIVN